MYRELKNALGPSFDNSSFDDLACFHNNKLVITNDDLDPDWSFQLVHPAS